MFVCVRACASDVTPVIQPGTPVNAKVRTKRGREEESGGLKNGFKQATAECVCARCVRDYIWWDGFFFTRVIHY